MDKRYEEWLNPIENYSALNDDDVLKDVASKKNLDWLFLKAIDSQESAGKKDAVSPTGVYGRFQMTGSTAEHYGITDRNDFKQIANAASTMVRELTDKYDGDYEKILGAYNTGEGVINQAMKLAERNGTDWRDELDNPAMDNVVVSIMGAKRRRGEPVGTFDEEKLAKIDEVGKHRRGIYGKYEKLVAEDMKNNKDYSMFMGDESSQVANTNTTKPIEEKPVKSMAERLRDQGIPIPDDSYDSYANEGDGNFLLNSYNAVESASSGLALSAAKIPGALLETMNVVGNNINKLINAATGSKLKTDYRAPDVMFDNPLTRYLEADKERYDVVASKYKGEDLTSLISKGDVGRTADFIYLNVLQQVPQMVTIAAAQLAGVPANATVGLLGATSGADKLDEYRDRYAAGETNASPEMGVLNAWVSGGAEAIFTKLGTFGIMKKLTDALKGVPANHVAGALKNTFMGFLGGFANEAKEETATSLTQDIADKISGVNDKPWKQVVKNAFQSGAIGGFSGGPLGALGGGVEANAEQNRPAIINPESTPEQVTLSPEANLAEDQRIEEVLANQDPDAFFGTGGPDAFVEKFNSVRDESSKQYMINQLSEEEYAQIEPLLFPESAIEEVPTQEPTTDIPIEEPTVEQPVEEPIAEAIPEQEQPPIETVNEPVVEDTPIVPLSEIPGAEELTPEDQALIEEFSDPIEDVPVVAQSEIPVAEKPKVEPITVPKEEAKVEPVVEAVKETPKQAEKKAKTTEINKSIPKDGEPYFKYIGNEYIEIPEKYLEKVSIPGYEEYDFFASKDQGSWVLHEGKSGSVVYAGDEFPFPSKRSLIEDLMDGGFKPDKKVLDDSVFKIIKKRGVSPRYEKQTIEENKVEPKTESGPKQTVVKATPKKVYTPDELMDVYNKEPNKRKAGEKVKTIVSEAGVSIPKNKPYKTFILEYTKKYGTSDDIVRAQEIYDEANSIKTQEGIKVKQNVRQVAKGDSRTELQKSKTDPIDELISESLVEYNPDKHSSIVKSMTPVLNDKGEVVDYTATFRGKTYPKALEARFYKGVIYLQVKENIYGNKKKYYTSGLDLLQNSKKNKSYNSTVEYGDAVSDDLNNDLEDQYMEEDAGNDDKQFKKLRDDTFAKKDDEESMGWYSSEETFDEEETDKEDDSVEELTSNIDKAGSEEDYQGALASSVENFVAPNYDNTKALLDQMLFDKKIDKVKYKKALESLDKDLGKDSGKEQTSVDVASAPYVAPEVKKDDTEYHEYDIYSEKYVPALKAEKVTHEGYDGYDFFVSKVKGKGFWRVTEASSGFVIPATRGETKEGAIAAFKNFNMDKAELDATIAKTAKKQGISPKHGGGIQVLSMSKKKIPESAKSLMDAIHKGKDFEILEGTEEDIAFGKKYANDSNGNVTFKGIWTGLRVGDKVVTKPSYTFNINEGIDTTVAIPIGSTIEQITKHLESSKMNFKVELTKHLVDQVIKPFNNLKDEDVPIVIFGTTVESKQSKKVVLGKNDLGALVKVDGKPTILLNPNISAADILPTLVHELWGHFGVYKVINDVDGNLANHLQDLFHKDSDSKFTSELAEVYAEDIKKDSSTLFNEWIAKRMEQVVERYFGKNGNFNDAVYKEDAKILDRVYHYIKNFISKIYDKWVKKSASEEEINNVMIAIAQKFNKITDNAYDGKTRKSIATKKPRKVKTRREKLAINVEDRIAANAATTLPQLKQRYFDYAIRRFYGDNAESYRRQIFQLIEQVKSLNDDAHKKLIEITKEFSDWEDARIEYARVESFKKRFAKNVLKSNKQTIEIKSMFDALDAQYKEFLRFQTVKRLSDRGEYGYINRNLTREYSVLEKARKGINKLTANDMKVLNKIVDVKSFVFNDTNITKEQAKFSKYTNPAKKYQDLRDLKYVDESLFEEGSYALTQEGIDYFNDAREAKEKQQSYFGAETIHEKLDKIKALAKEFYADKKDLKEAKVDREAETVARFEEQLKGKKSHLDLTLSQQGMNHLKTVKHFTMDSFKFICTQLDNFSENGEFTKIYRTLRDGLNAEKKYKYEMQDWLKKKLFEGISERELATFTPLAKSGLVHKLLKDQDTEVKHVYWKVGNEQVKLTKSQRVAIYMYSKNDQALDHLTDEKGGFALDDKTNMVHKPSFPEIAQLLKDITPKEKHVADTLFEYFEKQGVKINEISMKDVGYELAGVSNYLPLRVKDDTVQKKIQDVKGLNATRDYIGDGKPGVLKGRTGSVKPLILEGALESMGRTSWLVEKYIGLALPSKYVESILIKIEPLMNMKNLSVELNALKRIHERVTRPGSYMHWTDNVTKSFDSLFVRAALGYNIPVALMQPVSTIMYTTQIKGKVPPLTPERAAKLREIKLSKRSDVLSRVLKYSAALRERYEGQQYAALNERSYQAKTRGMLFNQNTGIKRVFTAEGTTDMMSHMDKIVTGNFWKRNERYVAATTKNEIGSDAYFEEVAKLTEDMIENTQPVYDALDKPEALSLPMLRPLTFFTGQTIKNFQIVQKGLRDMVIGFQTDDHELALNGFKNVVITAVIQNAIIELIRTGWKALKGDDDDEWYKNGWKWIERLTVANISSMGVIASFIGASFGDYNIKYGGSMGVFADSITGVIREMRKTFINREPFDKKALMKHLEKLTKTFVAGNKAYDSVDIFKNVLDQID